MKNYVIKSTLSGKKDEVIASFFSCKLKIIYFVLVEKHVGDTIFDITYDAS